MFVYVHVYVYSTYVRYVRTMVRTIWYSGPRNGMYQCTEEPYTMAIQIY
jgi:hypothetical protein